MCVKALYLVTAAKAHMNEANRIKSNLHDHRSRIIYKCHEPWTSTLYESWFEIIAWPLPTAESIENTDGDYRCSNYRAVMPTNGSRRKYLPDPARALPGSQPEVS